MPEFTRKDEITIHAHVGGLEIMVPSGFSRRDRPVMITAAWWSYRVADDGRWHARTMFDVRASLLRKDGTPGKTQQKWFGYINRPTTEWEKQVGELVAEWESRNVPDGVVVVAH